SKKTLIIAIPLALSAFTHLFNPIGFPSIDHDEGHYMRRAMEVINGLGPQESKDVFPNPIDHPYFGQIFLAGALQLVNYPNSLNPSVISNGTSSTDDAVHFTEMLWVVPRVLIGLLAVVDTFLIYKIAERRYNNKTIALIASILFAVMPLSWMTRRIFLESIQLPLILSSILAAVYLKDSKRIQNTALPLTRTKNSNTFRITSLILISGIFLGLAIFTKVPAFTIIPAIGYLIYTNVASTDNLPSYSKRLLRVFHPNMKNIKMLGLWFIPIILIPMIWPLYSVSIGYSFDYWLSRVIYQGTRSGEAPLQDALYDDFIFDPVFTIIGLAGIIYAAVKREYFLLLWALPFLFFM
ncbi:MAG TPA: phospholipid carrier-dependent glycosyltransferase, partial [Nitrososphaeraceae archaeon]|nr:phospholipid carrier-dependent glycosyltransferase [Nitrososphaeraceae archaeon]